MQTALQQGLELLQVGLGQLNNAEASLRGTRALDQIREIKETFTRASHLLQATDDRGTRSRNGVSARVNILSGMRASADFLIALDDLASTVKPKNKFCTRLRSTTPELLQDDRTAHRGRIQSVPLFLCSLGCLDRVEPGIYRITALGKKVAGALRSIKEKADFESSAEGLDSLVLPP